MTRSPWRYYRFCPRCGSRLKLRRGESQPELACVTGDFVFYQNPHPAVSALVFNRQGNVLLVKRAHQPKRGYWDVPGGFIDWGEEASDAIVREIREELDSRFTPTSFFGGYHDWYDTRGLRVSVLNLYFLGRISGQLKPASDVAGFRWFPVNRLPAQLGFGHIRRAIRDYRRTTQRRA